jgi:hypothetical protein
VLHNPDVLFISQNQFSPSFSVRPEMDDAVSNSFIDGHCRLVLNLKEAATKQTVYTSSSAIGSRSVETWAAESHTQDANIPSRVVFNARQSPNRIQSLVAFDEFDAPLDDLNDSDATRTTSDTLTCDADNLPTYELPPQIHGKLAGGACYLHEKSTEVASS